MKRIFAPMTAPGRGPEWVTSTIMLAFAFALALPGDTVSGAAWVTFRQLGMDDAALAVPLAMIATARMAALYINGAWKRSPLVRMAGAIIGSAIWVNLSAAFAMTYFADAFNGGGLERGLSTAATTYLVLAGFDCVAAYRSGADYRATRGGTYGLA